MDLLQRRLSSSPSTVHPGRTGPGPEAEAVAEGVWALGLGPALGPVWGTRQHQEKE